MKWYRDTRVLYGMGAALVVCVVIIIYLMYRRPRSKMEYEPRNEKSATHSIQIEAPDDNVSRPPRLPSLVMFYSDGCEHCQNIKPDWDEAASRVNSSGKAEMLKFDMVNYRDLLAENNVSGVPDIRMYPDGFTSGDPQFVKYQGDRSIQSLMGFLENYVK